MQLGMELCFKGSTKLGNLYRTLFENYVRYEPEEILLNRKSYRWDKNKHMALLDNCDEEERLGITSGDSAFFTTVIKRPHPYRSISLRQNIDVFHPSEEDVLAIADRQGFTAAFLYNEDYEAIQSTVHEGNLFGRKFSREIMDSIENTRYGINVAGQKMYQTKYNPGSSLTIDYLYLMVAWKMWFGREFFQLVPKERILNFSNAIKVQEIRDDIVFVQLYENVEEPYIADNVFRQWKWREWLDYDSLLEKYG